MNEETRRKISEANRGQKRSEETKRRIGEARKGHVVSEETRRKISEANKGHPGRPHTEEELRKMSESQKGRTHPGHPMTEENKRKLKEAAQARRGKPLSEEHRRKISEAGKGHKISEETTRKRLETRYKNGVPDEMREQARKLGASNIGTKQTKETRQKKREAALRLASDPEYLAKVSAGVRRANENPETHARRAKAMSIVHRNKKRTSIEVIVASLLDTLEIVYEAQKHIGRYNVDFFVPTKNLIIECDGDYWHNKPGVKERDEKKDAWLQEQGYTVLRLPECQILKGEFGCLYDSLE